MKLRVKVGAQKTRVDVGQDCQTLGTLRTLLAPVLAQQFGLRDDTPFEISLNGRNALHGEDKPVSDLGLVSGDLVHILLPSDPQPSTSHGAQPHTLHHSSQEQASGLKQATGVVNNTKSAASRSKDPQQSTANQKDVTNSNTTNDVDADIAKNELTEIVVMEEGEEPPDCARKEDSKETHMDVEEEGNESLSMEGAGMEGVACEILSVEGAGVEGGSSESLSVEGAGVEGVPSEPMLCREASVDSVPLVLQQVYHANTVQSRHDALCVVLHVLMMESGFCTKDPSCAQDQDTIGGLTLPNGWKSPGVYKITYRHLACEGSSCTLTLVPMGSLLMVHGVVVGSSPSMHHQVQLRTDSFTQHLVQDPGSAYRNLPQLSRVFKDSIAQPLLADMRQLLGLPALHGLLALSAEIQLMVLQHLDVFSLVRLSGVCKDLHSVANDQSLWRFRYLRDFGEFKNKTSTLDWKELYKKHYQDRKKAREWLRHQRVLHPPPPPWAVPTPPHSFPPTYPPGFIGGDYDRYPPGMPGVFFPAGMGRGLNPSQPMVPPPLGPRFDPIGSLPEHQVIPGRGRGMRDSRGRMGASPSFGFMAKFF